MQTTDNNKPNPTTVTGERRSSNQLHAQLLRLVSLPNRHENRDAFRRIVCEHMNAVCVFHITLDQFDAMVFDQSDDQVKAPDSLAFAREIKQIAQQALDRDSTQIRQSDGNEPIQIVCTPVSLANDVLDFEHELLVALLPCDRQIQPSLFVIEVAASYHRIWNRDRQLTQTRQQQKLLAAIFDLVSQVTEQEECKIACQLVVDQTAKFLGCSRVAFGLHDRGKLRLAAISGAAQFDESSATAVELREALSETFLRNELCIWTKHEHQPPLLAHKNLANSQNSNMVVSAALVTRSDERVGAWILLFDSSTPHDGNDLRIVERFVRTSSSRIATAVSALRRAEPSRLKRLKSGMAQSLLSRRGLLFAILCVALMAMLAMPMPYRVRCRCVVEPTVKQFSVAPFQGMIKHCMVEPGEVVKKNDLLAIMDEKELRWQLSTATAELGQATKQRDIQLSQRAISDVILSQLEKKRLQSQIELLEHRLQNLKIRAPIAGIVLNSALEKNQSSPTQTGDVLFEIGELDRLRIELEIPAEDISQVRLDQAVRIWIDGHEQSMIDGTIDSIAPQSELRKNQNVFIAEVLLSNPQMNWKPGMRGSARIIGPERPLAWNLFHKPWDFVVSRMAGW